RFVRWRNLQPESALPPVDTHVVGHLITGRRHEAQLQSSVDQHLALFRLRKMVSTRAVPIRRSGNVLAMLQSHTDHVHCGRKILCCRLLQPSKPSQHVRFARPENYVSELLAMILRPPCQIVLSLWIAAMGSWHENPTWHVHT